MATFANADETLEILMTDRGETVAIAVGDSETYEMDIEFQIELGSLGSGAWRTLILFNTEDADDTFDYVTTGVAENLRLWLSRDGGGSATVTLTDTSDLIKKTITDGRGNNLALFRQSGMTVPGTLTVDGATTLTGNTTLPAGVVRTSGSIVAHVASALTLTEPLHAGRIVVTNIAATTTITLPLATGTGNVYTIYTSVVSTPADHIYICAGSDVMNGTVGVSSDIAGVMESAQLTDTTLTMNGTGGGGLAGSVVIFTDVASAVWWVSGAVVSTGTETTIFS